VGLDGLDSLGDSLAHAAADVHRVCTGGDILHALGDHCLCQNGSGGGAVACGAKIVLKALEAPLRQIAKNAGLEGSVIIDKIVSANKPNYGFDAQNEVYVEDMIAAGIVDPTKVTRSALENAASVAEMVLTTESLVADLPEPPAAPAAGGDMGGMGGMY